MLGLSLARMSGVREGKSHDGKRVLETPGGRQAELEASTIVNQDIGEEVERVLCMRQREQLCRAIQEDLSCE